MATPGSDPFSGTNTRNVLQQLLSPKLLANNTGGYDAKVDLTNIDNVYLTNTPSCRMLATYSETAVLTSTDYGENWSVLNTNSTFILSDCTSIEWNGRVWVAVGSASNGTTILTSLDGITWVSGTNGFTGYGSDVIWNGKLWIAVGRGTNAILTSLDGLSWVPAVTGLPGNIFSFYGIYYSRGRLVATGSINGGGGLIVYSDDAKNWTTSGANFLYAGYHAIGDENLWVATGQASAAGANTNTLLYSTDNAVTWTPATGIKFNVTGTTIAYHNGLFVAVGQDSGGKTILWSSDGKDWKLASGPLFSDYGDTVVWNGKRWVATGNNLTGLTPILLSNDGKIWTTSSGEKIPQSSNDSSFALGSNNVWETLPTSLNDVISSFANTLTNLTGKFN